MVETIRDIDSFQRRINAYVPAMQYASSAYLTTPTQMDLGTPDAAAVDNMLNTETDITTKDDKILGSDFDGTLGDETDAPFGRTLQIDPNQDPTSNSDLAVVGRDYLGQPMREDITITSGNANVVETSKAFKWVDYIYVLDGNATSSTTITVGTGSGLGLQYKTLAVDDEIVDDQQGTVGTLTQPDLTDAATATSGDPRGTYNPNATLDGSKNIVAIVKLSARVNSDGNGGLHGIKQYFAQP